MPVDDPRVAPWWPPQAYAPYGDAAVNGLYALLFADDGRALEASDAAAARAPGVEVMADRLAAEAFDAHGESRLRAVAYRRLRAVAPEHPGLARTALPLLGVVVEVGLAEGLDALAAYADRRVRYLNHSGAVSIFEDETILAPQVETLFDAAQRVVSAIGPWEGVRRPPPAAGTLRLSFLVGDLLLFGEGPIEAMSRDGLAGPVFAAAGAMLQRIVALTAGGGRSG